MSGTEKATQDHGWTRKSTYPLTAAMQDNKSDAPNHNEKPNNGVQHRENLDRNRSSEEETVHGDNQPGKGEKGSKLKKKDSSNEISNTNAKLANPFSGLSDDEVMNNAEKFAKEHDLPSELFRKGGLLAKRPQRFEMMKQLSEEDKEILRHEITHKYDQPFVLYNLVVACSIAAAVQGMDESVISGAQLSYPTQFGINSKITGNPQDVWLEGLVNGG